MAEQLLLKLKHSLLYDFLEKNLLSGILLTCKKNSALLLSYFLRTALEVRDGTLLRVLSKEVLVIQLSLQDLYNEVLFCSRLAFMVWASTTKSGNMGLVKRIVTRLLSNVLDIRKDLQGNPSRVMKNQKNSFLPKKAFSKVTRNSGDFNTVKLLGEYFLQIGTYLKKKEKAVLEYINVQELLDLCGEVRKFESKRELKRIWTQVINLWEGFIPKEKPLDFIPKVNKNEDEENLHFEKLEKFVKRSLSRNKKNVEIQNKAKSPEKQQIMYSKRNETKPKNDEFELNEIQTQNQSQLATILTDMVYEESAIQFSNKNKPFKIRKLKNFQTSNISKKRETKNPKEKDLGRVNNLKKQTGHFRRGRMFLKKRSGKGGGYVKGKDH